MLTRIVRGVLLLVASVALPAAASKVVVGEPVPEFTVTTVEGSKIAISELRGKRVLVFMWASW